jgi:acetoin utilization deacetylase AcuC-like enzyme
VLYVSLHQSPFYPGTGASTDIGRGKGAGFTVNLPLEGGAIDEDYRLAFSEVVRPVLLQFSPDFLLVSAGFDAHERDPLGGMRLTTRAFAAMTWELRRVAEECCQGRMVLVTEGGYDLGALAASLDGVVETLASPLEPGWPVSGISSDRGRRSVDAAKQALAPFWKFT